MRRGPALLAAVALAAGAPRAAPPLDPGTAAAGSAAPGFAQALTVRPFTFPDDHAAHPEFRQEWWYLTGNLDAADGERFGVELTFFRFALAPPDSAAPRAASAWRARQIYMAHFAVTDVGAQRFRFAQKLARDALQLSGTRAAPLRVWIDDWSLDAAPAAGVVALPQPVWHLSASQPGYRIELDATALAAAVLNGEAGLSRKADEAGAASFYYSLPRLSVRGRLVRDGQALNVTGLAWFDHEWGSGALGAHESGWDWYALQLSDGSTLMFYALRGERGGRDAHSAGTYVDPQGRARPLADAQVRIEVAGYWRDPQGRRYPSRWRLSVPELALDLTVRPVLADQELRTTPTYWEGAVDVSGTHAGSVLGGRGYVELVGYAPER
jgi:predicted secreted hydrolase